MEQPRVTRTEILNHPTLAPMLKMQLYAVFTKPSNGLAPVLEMLEKHLAYQVDLEQRGIMFGAGPFFAENEEDWEGAGMVIVRAGSLAEAKAIAAADPMHASGARSFTVRPWLLDEGTLTIKVTYSDGRRQIL